MRKKAQPVLMRIKTKGKLMKNKTILIPIIAGLLLTILSPQKAQADDKIAASSAAFIQTATLSERTDNRAQILKDYLNQYNSPLSGSAQTFINEADRYNLDWKFVAAISGLESSYGKHIPPNSYNGWGWGIYGDNVKYFTSWNEAIATISKGLREQYMDKWGAQDVYSIGHIYAASPTWAERVSGIMANMEKFQLNWTDTSLSLSL